MLEDLDKKVSRRMAIKDAENRIGADQQQDQFIRLERLKELKEKIKNGSATKADRDEARQLIKGGVQ